MAKKDKGPKTEKNKGNNPKSDNNSVNQTALQTLRDAAAIAPDYPTGTEFKSANVPEGYHKQIGQQGFSDPSDAYATQHKYFISLEGMSSGAAVTFKAFLTEYSDTFTANWNKEELIQRNDIIATYKNTLRTISIGWSVPCASIQEAQTNLKNTATLMKMLYGGYSSLGASSGNNVALTKPPLIKIRLANLLQDAPGKHLYVVVSSFTFSPDLDVGFFDPGENLLPKSWNLALEGDVLHEGKLGWNGSTWRGNQSFPFLPEALDQTNVGKFHHLDAKPQQPNVVSIGTVQEQAAKDAAAKDPTAQAAAFRDDKNNEEDLLENVDEDIANKTLILQ